MPADTPFLQQAVDGRLQRRGGRRQLVQKQDGRLCRIIRQVFRPVPDGALRCMVIIGQTAQVLRLDRGQAQVEQQRAGPVRQLLHDLGLADAGAAMQHPRGPHHAGRLCLPPRQQDLEGLSRRDGNRVRCHDLTSSGPEPRVRGASGKVKLRQRIGGRGARPLRRRPTKPGSFHSAGHS